MLSRICYLFIAAIFFDTLYAETAALVEYNTGYFLCEGPGSNDHTCISKTGMSKEVIVKIREGGGYCTSGKTELANVMAGCLRAKINIPTEDGTIIFAAVLEMFYSNRTPFTVSLYLEHQELGEVRTTVLKDHNSIPFQVTLEGPRVEIKNSRESWKAIQPIFEVVRIDRFN